MNEYQQTSEWFKARLGKLTASNMAAAMNVKKDGTDYADRLNLKMEILAERLTGETTQHFVSDPMRWGKEQEPIIKSILHELGCPILDTGFIDHPDILNFGASPDGFIGEDGLIEIKCPTTQTHLKWLMEGEIPDQHKPQMIAQALCTGRTWVEFISFDPRIQNPTMRIFKRTYIPEDYELVNVKVSAMEFLDEVSKMQELLMDAYL